MKNFDEDELKKLDEIIDMIKAYQMLIPVNVDTYNELMKTLKD